MSKKSRVPLQVSDDFVNRLKELQRKIRMTSGDDKSLRQLTEDIIKSPAFIDIEKAIIGNKSLDISLNVKFDRRRI